MPGIELLSSDLLADIMLMASESIDEKLALAQVSQLWRYTALDNPLLWALLIGTTELDFRRIPLMLERTGSTTMLHIDFNFAALADHDGDDTTHWTAHTLGALDPFVARIESLCLKLGTVGWVQLSPLLGSGVEFPALKALHLSHPRRATIPLSLSAPQLRSLKMENFDMKNWDLVLVPSLEKINLREFEAGRAGMKTLSDIFRQCPRAWSITIDMESYRPPESTPADLQLSAHRPLAVPRAVRELELRLPDLVSVLKIGFCDTVVKSLTGWVRNGDRESEVVRLLNVMFPGVGPLVICDSDRQQIEFHDDSGRIRCVGCYDRYSHMAFPAVWKHLSIHHGVHKTVRELRISTRLSWSEYIDAFELYPPAQESITLGIDVSGSPRSWRSKNLRISGLKKIEIIGSWTHALISQVLRRIDLPGSRQIEVCISDETPEEMDSLLVALLALQTALSKLADNWVVCAHCLAMCTSHPENLSVEGGLTA